MKKLIALTILSFFILTLFAQVQLDVVGDAKIEGNLDLSNGTNLFIGQEAGIFNTGDFNTFIGVSSGTFNTTGLSNTFIGLFSGFSNTEGKENTFIGTAAGLANTTGDENTFVGMDAGRFNTGKENTFMGRMAGTNTTGNFNTFMGKDAGRLNTSGRNNTFVGWQAGDENTDGIFNTFLGNNGGNHNTTGIFNTFVGAGAGQDNITGDNNTFVGVLSGVAFGDGALSNSMALGFSSRVTASNTIAIGDTDITSIQGQVNFTTFSDGRYKLNVKENVPGLDFVLQLRPVSYQMDVQGIANFLGIEEQPSSKNKKEKNDVRDTKSKIRYSGFIAQEVNKAAIDISYDFSGVDKPQNEHSLFGLRYAEFVVPLVKGMQEQQEIITQQEVQIKKLEEGYESQQQQIDELKSMVEKLLTD